MSDTPKPEFDTLPWIDGGTSYRIIDSVGAEVASFDYTKDRDYALHCVATHPALVEALEHELKRAEYDERGHLEENGYREPELTRQLGKFDHIKRMRAALLAAKGESNG